MVLQLNPTYSHSQVRSRHIALQSPMMDLVWILLFMVPGGGRFEKAFLDVRVFNPNTQLNQYGP